MKLGKFEVDGNDLFNKAIWGILVCILSFSAKKINDMSNNLESLNLKMVQVITDGNQVRTMTLDHELRLRNARDEFLDLKARVMVLEKRN